MPSHTIIDLLSIGHGDKDDKYTATFQQQKKCILSQINFYATFKDNEI